MARPIAPSSESRLTTRVRVLRFEKNAGQSAAMYAGLQAARGASGGAHRWRSAKRSGRYSAVARGDRARRRSGLRLSRAAQRHGCQTHNESSRQFCPEPFHEGRRARYRLHFESDAARMRRRAGCRSRACIGLFRRW